WAGRIVSRFSDEAVRAIVHTGGFTDPEAEAHLAEVLLRRRDKVVAWTFRQVNPVGEFSIEEIEGRPVVTFRNLGEEAGLAAVESYEYAWLRLDNATGATEALAGDRGTTFSRRLPVPASEDAYLVLRLWTTSAGEPGWNRRVDVTLRREGGWSVIGVDREG
ncbi:MAG TPA: hypothetical protein VFK70_06205, partial [Vicinamibacteria bacterium]|nr:hypothetical protein [Vicinamibacteria bacterium]